MSLNTAIRYFRHALSLDERRAKFKANVYNRPTAEEAKLGMQPGEMPTPTPPPHIVKEWNIAAKAVEAYKTLGSGVNMRLRKVDVKAQGRDRIEEEGDDDIDGKDEDEDSDDADAKYDPEFNLEADKKPENERRGGVVRWVPLRSVTS